MQSMSEQPPTSSHRMKLGGILLIAVVLRLGVWFWLGSLPIEIHDEKDYHALAVSLAERGEFGFREGTPSSIRPPLYPFFVAAIYRTCGVGNFAAVRLVQAVISLGGVLLVYHLGTIIWNRRVGLTAAAISAVYPALLGANHLLLTEVIFTFLLLASVWAIVRGLQTERLVYWITAGGLIGLAALTRSILWLFPLTVGVFLLCAYPVAWWRRLLAVVCLAASTAVVLAPWAIRNTRLQETFTTVDVMSGRNLMMGNYEYTPLYRAWDAISVSGEENWLHVLRQSHPEVSESTQGQIDKLALRYALDYMAEHPGLTLLRSTIKFFNFWQLERELVAGAGAGFFGDVSRWELLIWTAVIFGTYAMVFLTGMFGMWLAGPVNGRIHALLILTMAHLCGLHTLTFGHSRYHLPLIPILMLFAAAAITQAPSLWARRKEWPFMAASGLCGIFILSWIWEIVMVDFQRFRDAVQGLWS